MMVARAPDEVIRTHARGAPNRSRALVLVLVLVLCGCGTTALSDSQLRSRTTSLCLQASTQTRRIPTPTSPAAAVAFFKRGIGVLSPELAALRALTPPRGAVTIYTTALSTFRGKLVALADTVRDLASGEDPVIATKTLEQQLAPLESQENDAWRALGVSACMNR